MKQIQDIITTLSKYFRSSLSENIVSCTSIGLTFQGILCHFDSPPGSIKMRKMILGKRLVLRINPSKHQHSTSVVNFCLLECGKITFQKAAKSYLINFYTPWNQFPLLWRLYSVWNEKFWVCLQIVWLINVAGEEKISCLDIINTENISKGNYFN